MRCQGGKEQRTAGQRRKTESYGNATYKVSERKGVIEIECMGSGSRREWKKREGRATIWPEEIDKGETLIGGTWDRDNQAEDWRKVVQIVTEEEYIELFGKENRWQNILWRLEWDWSEKYRDTRGTECGRQHYIGRRIRWDKWRRVVTAEESHWRIASYTI